MKDLNYFKEKIKEKRKQTSFRAYIKEIVSHFPMTYYKNSGVISKFPESDRVWKVISAANFSKNADNLTKKWLDYDFNLSLFENYEKLFLQTDIFNVIDHWGAENSDYADMVYNSKNAYLSTVVISNCENVLYSISTKDNCTNVFNSIATWSNSENIYFCSGILNSFNIFYSRFINNCNNIWFSTNLVWCSECINCNNLDNQKYCINNEKLEKAEYLLKKEEILKNKLNFEKNYLNLDKKWDNINSKNTTWSSMFSSENVENWYFWYYVKDSKNVMFTGWVDWDHNMYDVFTAGSPTAHDFYWVMWANWENLYCCKNITLSSNLFYSYWCDNCSNLIWCIWLKNKNYCILNKQYSKEDWEKLASKIFKTMEKDWTLWEFFPASLNPFYFNDTVAGLIWWFKKEEIIKEGFMWRDEKIKVDIPDESIVVDIEELNKYEWFDENWNWQLNSEILKKVIKDKSWDYYKIVKMEYDFLQKHWLPLPRLHWLERMKVNFGV